jgi:hypothetical protein
MTKTMCFLPHVNSASVCEESARADGWDGHMAAGAAGPGTGKSEACC